MIYRSTRGKAPDLGFADTLVQGLASDGGLYCPAEIPDLPSLAGADSYGEVARAVDVPVVGVGGIMTAGDALEFLIAGATAVQVGTANFVNPAATVEIIDGLKGFLARNGIAAVREIIGSLET